MKNVYISESKVYDRLDNETQDLVKKFLSSLPLPEFLENVFKKNLEQLKEQGYVYSEIERENCYKINRIRYYTWDDKRAPDGDYYLTISYVPTIKINIPYTDIVIRESVNAEKTTYFIKATSPKAINSLGAELTRRIKPVIAIIRAEEEAEQEEKKRKDAIEEEEKKIKRAAEAEEREKRDQPERDFIKSWIEQNGSERLKKAYALDLKYFTLFKRAWAAATFGTENTKIYFDSDDISEFEPGVPSLEKLQKYEERREYVKTIKEFKIDVDLSNVVKVDPEYRDEEQEEEAAALGIVYKVKPLTMGDFIVVEFI